MEKNINAASMEGEFKRPSQAKEIWRRFKKSKGALIGLVLLIVLVLVLLIGPLLVPYSRATTQDFVNMLSEAREFLRNSPHMMVFPAAAIVLTACAINLVGDGLRDALDPQLKS